MTKRKHGQSSCPTQYKKRTKEYMAWASLRNRCTNPRNPAYKHYGGRGIDYAPRWDDFSIFYAEVGPAPSSRHSIDRIDNNKGYWPGNCRWALPHQQLSNTRRSRQITWQGETLSIRQWEIKLGFAQGALNQRLAHGWSVKRALTEPFRKYLLKG